MSYADCAAADWKTESRRVDPEAPIKGGRLEQGFDRNTAGELVSVVSYRASPRLEVVFVVGDAGGWGHLLRVAIVVCPAAPELASGFEN